MTADQAWQDAHKTATHIQNDCYNVDAPDSGNRVTLYVFDNRKRGADRARRGFHFRLGNKNLNPNAAQKRALNYARKLGVMKR